MGFLTTLQSSFRFRQLAPAVLLLLSTILVFFAFFGDESYVHLKALQAELGMQRTENATIGEHVGQMRSEVVGLQKNDRVLEKAARNELGMVRSNEILFVFKDKPEGR